ncbi:hypothetical protein BGX33_002802, partial [Mortierella sp. NVP41]
LSAVGILRDGFFFLKRLHGDGEGEEGEEVVRRENIFGGGDLDDSDDDGYGNDFGGPGDAYDDLDQDQFMKFEQNQAQQRDDYVEDTFGDLDAQIEAHQSGPAIERLMANTTEDIGKVPTVIFACFDSALPRNWAGPEHWKLRRIPKEKNPDPNAVPEEGIPEDEETAAAPKKNGKAPLVINFLDAPEVDEDDLFAPAEASSLLLSASGQSESRKSTYLFPDDIHFSSKQLLRMFLKPTPIIKSMNKKLQGGPSQQRESLEPLTTNFPDMEFWASHTNNVHDDGDMTALTDQLDQIQIYNDYDEEDDDYGSQDQGYFAGPGGEGLGMGGPLGF